MSDVTNNTPISFAVKPGPRGRSIMLGMKLLARHTPEVLISGLVSAIGSLAVATVWAVLYVLEPFFSLVGIVIAAFGGYLTDDESAEATDINMMKRFGPK